MRTSARPFYEKEPEPAIQESIETIYAASVVAMHMLLQFKGFDWKGLHRALILAGNELRALAESNPDRLGRVLAARNSLYLGDNTLQHCTPRGAPCSTLLKDGSAKYAGKACTCGAITD